MTCKLDRRTRCDADRRDVTPAEFFGTIFPGLAAAHGHLVAAGARALAAPPLAVEVEGAAWTLLPEGDHLIVRPGIAEDAVIVTLTPAQFSDWVQNQMTLNGFVTMRALAFRDGTLTDISVWDSFWIALLEGWPVVDEGLTFLDRHGAPLDLATTFTPADDPADILHFLREAGFLHLRGWLDLADMAVISADMDRALPHYIEGDGKSWWAALEDGSRRCVRMQQFLDHSPTTARVLAGQAWAALHRLISGPDNLLPAQPVEALFKPVGVVSGPSDVNWHRDCHLGRHAYVCARRTLGIAITPTGDGNGALQVIPGSHRLAMPVAVARDAPYLPVLDLPTQSGDVTVHLSCTLHQSTPPLIAERRVMYMEAAHVPLAGTSTDTSVGEVREQISEIHRKQHEAAV